MWTDHFCHPAQAKLLWPRKATTYGLNSKHTWALVTHLIVTLQGVKMRCVCKPDQTLFSATKNKIKKQFGYARLLHYLKVMYVVL